MLKLIFEIAGALLIGAAAVAVVVAIVTWNEIKSWFNARRYKIDNKDKVARTITDQLANGNYSVKYGVFDKRNNSFSEVESKECRSIDSELKAKHDYGQTRIVDHVV